MNQEEFAVEALFDAVIIKPLESSEEMYGNIIVPDLGKEKNLLGIIVSVGEGSHTVTGQFVPTTMKVGDKVIIPAMGFTKFELEGEEYLVGNEKQLIGRFKNK